MKELTGRIFGYWKVQDHYIIKNNKRKWHCICRCKTERYVDEGNLLNGKSKSCGCLSIQLTKERVEDLTGRTFGNLTVLRRSEARRHGLISWECQCQCGNKFIAVGNDLRSGRVKSCGCLKAAFTTARDLRGQTFGLLTAQNPTEERDYKGSVIWACTCTCGGEIKLSQDMLMRKKNHSCGCVKVEAKGLRSTLRFVDGTCLEFLTRKQRIDNTSGHTGVYVLKNGKYRVGIGFKKKRYYLGIYDTMEEAVRIRERAKEMMHKEFLEKYDQEKIGIG